MRMLGIVLLALLGFSSLSSAAEELSSSDFAYGYMLKVQGDGAVYSLPLPNEVYRTVRRADLGDINVFNSAGETVPYALRLLETEQDVSRVTAQLPFFPLFEKDPGSADNMSLSVRRNADGTIIDIDSSRVKPEGDIEPTGYLLDLGEKALNVGDLEIYWNVDTAHASSTVMVQHSPDLQSWWPLVRKVTLVDLEYEGNRVEQRKIALPADAERYLKIVWLQSSPSLTFSRVTAVSRPLVRKQNLQWVSLNSGQKTKVNDYTGIDFTSEYRLPVRSVRLQFPEPNSIVKASVQSRMDAAGEWREQCRGLFYSLEMTGEKLQSEPCSFRATTDRQWRLVVLDDGAGITGGNSSVILDLGWQSDELLFVARGTGPFILAYGSGKLEHSALDHRTDMVLTAVQQQAGEIVQAANLGKHLELGGQRALVPPPPPRPWKTWLLWAVLVAGVLAMAVMASSLFRDLRNAKQGAGDD